MSETQTVNRVRIAGRPFVLRRGDVIHAVSDVDPEPIASQYVVIGSRRFPPKQVISEVTGLDRADFTSHQARRTLTGLGFTAGRRGAGRPGRSPAGREPGPPR
jgi:5-methylcytosine-specific restriction protein B